MNIDLYIKSLMDIKIKDLNFNEQIFILKTILNYFNYISDDLKLDVIKYLNKEFNIEIGDKYGK